jgi:hypothetical protein
MAEFLPGLQLNGLFYAEIVRPLLGRHFPGLTYAAALLGPGSDVLGFDTPRSMDHDWGPRLQLFLPPAEFQTRHEAIDACLRQHLPASFRGFSVNFSQPNDGGTQWLEPVTAGPINHRILITTVEEFCQNHFGITSALPRTAVDWLALSEQKLLEITAGALFHDGFGALTALRTRLAYYPHDLWLYRLAAQWGRIGQEEAFMGRCGEVGDELGSRLVAARLVRELMRLAFLLERRYAPYSKWLGTAFARLPCAGQLMPLLQTVLAGEGWQLRQTPLCAAYVLLAELHNSLGITEPIPPTITSFFDRPFQVLGAERFATAALAAIGDPAVRALPPGLGGVDQFVDCTEVTTQPPLSQALTAIYGLDQS